PPFFTLQPNAAVRAKQLALWTQLVLDHCKFHRVFLLDVSDPGGTPLFKNSALQRQMTGEGLRALAAHMIAEGAAAWADESEGSEPRGGRSRLLIFWRSPSAWADSILRFAEDCGLVGSVETVQSLIDGELAQGKEFHGAPREMILVALQELSRRGRATIFRGSAPGSEGVKFLPS
ncbi:unnamed protein product, partial [Polarella glacialis]